MFSLRTQLFADSGERLSLFATESAFWPPVAADKISLCGVAEKENQKGTDDIITVGMT